jgi:preprotein translocase SecY subunit
VVGARGFVQSVSRALPEVKKPIRKLSLNERLIWTIIALVVFLAMAQVPLYGVPVGLQDQLAYTRVIFASSQGTLMELGIGPIVTAGLILQLLKGAEIIKLDFKKPEDRALFSSATKLLTIGVIIMEASAFIAGGVFGTQLTSTAVVLILAQLIGAGLLVILLDELVQKGWGIGSGISLFIMAGVAQQVMWSIFSVFPTGSGFLGVVPFTISSILAGVPGEAFYRGTLPSISSLIITILVILFIIYIEGVRVEIPITSTQYRGFAGVYPIKLLYTSVVPVILISALLANISFFSQMISTRFNPLGQDFLVNLLVRYDLTNPAAGPIGGLLYYITSPGTLEATALDPLRAVTYILFIVAGSVMFAKVWVEIGGLAPHAAAKNLIDAKIQIPGFRRSEASVEALLKRYIPSITIISGIIIGLLAGGADLLGTFGSGTGLLLMIDILLNYYQMLMRERLETTMPRLAGVLGKKT